MDVRALRPWLLVGALLASAYANFTMIRGSSASQGTAQTTKDPKGSIVPDFHLSPSTSGEKCPTLELLELSSEQRAQLKIRSLTSLSLRTDLALEIEELALEIDRQLSAAKPDKDSVMGLADRLSSLRSQQYKDWIHSILVVRDVLTPDQMRLLNELETN